MRNDEVSQYKSTIRHYRPNFYDHQSAADREPVYCSGISQHGRSERRRRRKHSGADQQQSKCNGHVHCGNAEPFIAYLLGFIKDHLHDGDYDYAIANLFLMIIAEAMIQNFIYVLMLIFLTYKCVKTYQIPVKGFVKRMAGNHLLRDISGSLVVLVFAGICMFAMLRLS